MNKIIIKALLITVMCSSIINCVREKANPQKTLPKVFLKLEIKHLKITKKLMELAELVELAELMELAELVELKGLLAKKENITPPLPLFKDLLTDEEEQETIVRNTKNKQQEKNVQCPHCDFKSKGKSKPSNWQYLINYHIPSTHGICTRCETDYHEESLIITSTMVELPHDAVIRLNALACAASHSNIKKFRKISPNNPKSSPCSECSWIPQQRYQQRFGVPEELLYKYHDANDHLLGN